MSDSSRPSPPSLESTAPDQGHGVSMVPPPSRARRTRIGSYLHGLPLSWRLIAVLVTLLTAALMVASFATSTAMQSYLHDTTLTSLRDELDTWSRRNAPPGREFTPRRCVERSTSFMVIPPPSDLGRDPGIRPQAYMCTSEAGDRAPDFDAWYRSEPAVAMGQPFTIPSVNDENEWLAVAGTLANGTGRLIVAAPLEPINRMADRLRWLMMVISGVLVGSCVIIGWFAIQRAFRPLRVIEDTASAIAQGDLTRRIPERHADDELASLTRSLNAMLAQIEASFAVREASENRMRRFVTDASHELRTPLATIRGYAELYRQGAAATPEATTGAMHRIEDEATRMAALVEDLLTLARLDNSRPMRNDVVDLTVLAADVVQDAIARDPARTIRLVGLDARGLTPTLVDGDDARLRQVLTNIMANAMNHTPPGSPVEVVVGISREHRARVEIRDHGVGIPPEKVPMVFERFYREDPARCRSTGGTGLGLAIVSAIIESHHGRVGVAATPGGGATFVIDLPLSERPEALEGPEDDGEEEPTTA